MKDHSQEGRRGHNRQYMYICGRQYMLCENNICIGGRQYMYLDRRVTL